MTRKARITTLALALTLVLSLLAPVKAEAVSPKKDLVDITTTSLVPAEQPDISARSAYLIELNSGEVLYAKNADEDRYPASITKILTALVVLENANLSDSVTLSHASVSDLEDGGYDSRFEEGDVLTVEDLLYGMMLDSVNTCAYALAEHVAGSVAEFAVMMNQKALELGCTNSNFENPHGLNNEKHRTTAHDMALIMWAAMENEDFARIDGTVSYTTAPTPKNSEGYTFTMHHKMMDATSQFYNETVKAGKTGYTSLAYHTLVTYAEKDGVELICVVMKETAGNNTIYNDTQQLLDYGFNNFSLSSLDSAAEGFVMSLNAVSPIPVQMPTDITVYLPTTVTDAGFNYVASSLEGSVGALQLVCGDTILLTKNLTVDTEKLTISEPVITPEPEPEEEEGSSPIIVILKIFGIIIAIGVLAIGGYWCYIQLEKRRRNRIRAAKKRRKELARKMRRSR